MKVFQILARNANARTSLCRYIRASVSNQVNQHLVRSPHAIATEHMQFGKRFMTMSTSSLEEDILSKLKVIIDPDLHQDIVSLGFVKDLKIEGSSVSFCLELTTPACPVREEFRTSAEAAVRSLPWVKTVAVTLSSSKKKRASAPVDDKSGAGKASPLCSSPEYRGGTVIFWGGFWEK